MNIESRTQNIKMSYRIFPSRNKAINYSLFIFIFSYAIILHLCIYSNFLD